MENRDNKREILDTVASEINQELDRRFLSENREIDSMINFLMARKERLLEYYSLRKASVNYVYNFLLRGPNHFPRTAPPQKERSITTSTSDIKTTITTRNSYADNLRQLNFNPRSPSSSNRGVKRKATSTLEQPAPPNYPQASDLSSNTIDSLERSTPSVFASLQPQQPQSTQDETNLINQAGTLGLI